MFTYNGLWCSPCDGCVSIKTVQGLVSMLSLQVVFAIHTKFPKCASGDNVETCLMQIESDHLSEVVSKMQIAFLTDVEAECSLCSN